MKKKLRVGILFGGQSAEHEVSLQSAKNIINALDKAKYEPVLVGIDKSGVWHGGSAASFLLEQKNQKIVRLNARDDLAIRMGKNSTALVSLDTEQEEHIDVVFPVLHGPYGEDGTVQGLLKLAGIPFVGASVLGSVIGMDKDVTKRLLRDAGIAVANFITVTEKYIQKIKFTRLKKKLGLPLFIKPANLGSSVGVHKVKTQKEFQAALEDAFRYDNKILVEECIAGREIECAVLGNEDRIASIPGEIIPKHEFYSYEAKYVDDDGAMLKIPAKLSRKEIKKVQGLAIKTCEVLCAEGMARVDFFLKKNGELLVNEINTIPGFTKISMYPKLWEASGLSYSALLDRLIALAFERFEKEKTLKNSRE